MDIHIESISLTKCSPFLGGVKAKVDSLDLYAQHFLQNVPVNSKNKICETNEVKWRKKTAKYTKSEDSNVDNKLYVVKKPFAHSSWQFVN